jgi:uncharacterized protein YggE
MASLTVRGDAVRPARPDEVVLRLTLSAVRTSPGDAFDDVAQRSETLQQVLTNLGIDSASRSTTEIRLDEKREFDKGVHHHRGYEATTAVLIRLGNAASPESQDLVAQLVGETVSQVDARFEGPWWRIRLENPAWSEVRREAALDARRKAEDYATALDLRLGPIVEIREPGTNRRAEDRLHHVAALSSDEVMAASPSLRVESGDLDVYASVEVTFGLEPA